MTEKKVASKTKEPIIPAAKKASAEKPIQPAEVVAMAKELKIDPDSLIGWNVYPDRTVIISANGMKFSKENDGSKSN